MTSDIIESAKELEKESKWIEAASLYLQTLKISPTFEIYERISWCFSRAGEYQKATEYLLKLHEMEPLSAKWLYMIGYQYYCQKHWATAVEWFERAIERYPDYFIVKYRLAYAYVQIAGTYAKLTKAEYWKAIGQLKDCHKLWDSFDEKRKQKERSTYFDVNFLHGKILMDLPRHYSEAIQLFKAALAIKPNDGFAQYNLSKTYYLSGEYQKAKDSIPSGNEYYIIELTAYIEAKMGNYSNAIKLIERLLQRRKRDYLYAFLADVYLLNNDLDNAYKAAVHSTILGQNNHKCFYVLAKVFYRYGLLDKAIEHLEIAIRTKRTKYDASFTACDELREIIERERPIDYKDDVVLIEKLSDGNAPQSTNTMMSTICRFNSEKGYGFIKGSPTDIFFHVSNCKYNGICVNDRVQFSTTNTAKGIMAVDIKKVD